MRKVAIYIVGLLCSLSISISCSNTECPSSDKSTIAPINPNGDSELALLMRDMFDEAMIIKEQVDNDKPVAIKLDHHEILTAHATEPEKAASSEYKTFANLYLQSIESLRSADKNQVPTMYENMVANCTACHQALCPGPLVKIEKLR